MIRQLVRRIKARRVLVFFAVHIDMLEGAVASASESFLCGNGTSPRLRATADLALR